MPDFLKCPACGADRGGADSSSRCGDCGAIVEPASPGWYPYHPPSAALSVEGRRETQAIEVPRSVLGKLGLTLYLFGENLPLIAAIVLTVWLPGAIAIDFARASMKPEAQTAASFQLTNVVQGIFGPIVSGALIFVIAGRLRGERVGYPRAMGGGLRVWGRLFAANFFAGIYILIGTIALIVPGIVLAVRYALVEPAVVLDRAVNPRRRSTELTSGRRWPIFAVGLIYFASLVGLTIAVGFVVGLAAERLPWLDNPWTSIAMDCVTDVLSATITIALVLFHEEARRLEAERSPAEPVEGPAHPEPMVEPA